MKKPALKSIKKLTKNKYINMYKLVYDYAGQKIVYDVASRRDIDEKTLNEHKVDGVIVLPYFIEGDQIFVVFTKEFRYAINDFVYDFPAGCVDNGEKGGQTVVRELKEEIGASVESLEECTDFSFISPGFANETSQTFFARIKLDQKTNLEPHEIITTKIVKFEDVLKFVGSHTMSAQGKMIAKIFYYKTMLEQLKNKK